MRQALAAAPASRRPRRRLSDDARRMAAEFDPDLPDDPDETFTPPPDEWLPTGPPDERDRPAMAVLIVTPDVWEPSEPDALPSVVHANELGLLVLSGLAEPQFRWRSAWADGAVRDVRVTLSGEADDA